ncbi:hypothetical protein OW763_11675 [Clostridium aestuarii]|uniref:Uncharacterized protein n=1 Tax=Clostridium aestuarii TaxID=338193 RepID=A0ABT4D4N2_9CLOT|nr:hypothetical protein [Clostridium aestuarii]MCY6485003.1 hypothetical protein [Clostridium aestuarii]
MGKLVGKGMAEQFYFYFSLSFYFSASFLTYKKIKNSVSNELCTI